MKNKVLLFVIGLAILLAFQAKIVMPIIYDIVSSDLFLEDSGDEKNRVSSSTVMTNIAYDQCNAYIANNLYPDHTFTFSEKPLNAFSLGNFSYIINADLNVLPADKALFKRRYACRIRYLEGNNTTDASDPENWSIDGLSGLDEI